MLLLLYILELAFGGGKSVEFLEREKSKHGSIIHIISNHNPNCTPTACIRRHRRLRRIQFLVDFAAALYDITSHVTTVVVIDIGVGPIRPEDIDDDIVIESVQTMEFRNENITN
jgi:hypothetical protein